MKEEHFDIRCSSFNIRYSDTSTFSVRYSLFDISTVRYSFFLIISDPQQPTILKNSRAMSFLIDPYALEEDFPERILDRGASYWATGAIAQLSQDGSGVWRATVVGSRNYKVSVSPSEDEMVVCGCSCPYAADAPCKHIAAVLLELEDMELMRELDFGEDDLSEEDPDSELETFEELLKKADREKLAGFVRSVCEADPLVHHKFMAYMTPSDSSAGKPAFRRMIEAGLASAKWTRYSYEEELSDATGPAYELLDRAERLAESGSWETVIDICQAVIEEMIPELEYIDDSYGEIGGAIDQATVLLAEAAEESLDEDLQRRFFGWCMESVQGGEYEDWDTQEDLMTILLVLADGKEQVAQLETFLDERMKELGQMQTSSSSKYSLERTVLLKITLLRDENRSGDAGSLMEKYRHLPRVLEMMIESAWEAEDIDSVEKLAQNAIDVQGTELRGLVSGWMEWLVKVAEARGDDNVRQERLKELFFKTPTLENFRRFKSAVPQDQWAEMCDEVIADLKKSRYPFYLLPEIYNEENRMGDLVKWLKNNPSFDSLNRYGRHFRKSHPEIIFAMYEELIRKYLARNMGRKYYREMVQILMDLSRSGFSKQVSPLVKDLKEEYHNRPALQDEFGKL